MSTSVRFRLGVALVVVVALSGCRLFMNSSPEEMETGFAATLQALGVDTELGSLEDPDGGSVRADYNPFSTKRRYLNRITETYIAGTPYPGGGLQTVLDDVDAGGGVLYSDNEAWAALPKVSASGDFDGDGREEVAVLVLNNNSGSAQYRQLSLRVVEDEDEGFAIAETLLDTIADLAPFTADGAAAGYYYKLDIAAADVDGDGRDEICVTCLSDLWVLDDRAGGYKVLFSEHFPLLSGHSQYLRVAGADTDCDGKAEVVVAEGQMSAGTGRVYYYMYDAGGSELDSGLVQAVDSVVYTLMSADLAAGDVDGDGLIEVVFAGRESGESVNQVLIMDDGRTGAGHEFLPAHYQYGFAAPFVQPPPIARVETGDFDGDGVAEIVSFLHILDYDAAGGGFDLLSSIPDAYTRTGSNEFQHEYMLLAVGDMTADMKDDVSFFRREFNLVWDDHPCHHVVWGMDSAGVYTKLYENVWNINFSTPIQFPTLTCMNSDEDSALVEFTGHELLFTEPRILAVLAAPPSYADIAMDLVLAGTTFGQGSGSDVVSESSIGFTAGFSVGTEFEDRLFSQSKFRFMATVEEAIDWISTSSLTIEKAYYYNGCADADKVVFTVIPFDVYYYRVLASPLPAEVGTTMVVNVPRKPQTIFVDRVYYNDNNGDFFDVGSDILAHSIGNPYSYPHESSIDKSALLAGGGFYTDSMTTGQGSGCQTVEICLSEGSGAGTSYDLNVGVEIEAGFGGFLMGRSAGFHYGYEYTVTTTDKTIFKGTVGNIIAPATWAANHFDFGLYVEPMRADDQKFTLINYWVE